MNHSITLYKFKYIPFRQTLIVMLLFTKCYIFFNTNRTLFTRLYSHNLYIGTSSSSSLLLTETDWSLNQFQKYCLCRCFSIDEPQQLTHLKNLLTSTLLQKGSSEKNFAFAGANWIISLYGNFYCDPVEHLESIAKFFSGMKSVKQV
jgi:hypothetical protein